MSSRETEVAGEMWRPNSAPTSLITFPFPELQALAL